MLDSAADFGRLLAQADGGDPAALLWSILHSIAEGVVVADISGKVLVCNPAAQRITGMTPADDTLASWAERRDCFLADRTTPHPAEELPMQQALRGIAVDQVLVFFRSRQRPEGAWVSVNARPLRDAAGAVSGGSGGLPRRQRAAADGGAAAPRRPCPAGAHALQPRRGPCHR